MTGGGHASPAPGHDDLVLEVGVSEEVERDVTDGRHHGTDERSGAEEERPSVPILERLVRAVGRLLPVRHLVVHRRDVHYHSHRKAESCKQLHIGRCINGLSNSVKNFDLRCHIRDFLIIHKFLNLNI